MPAHNQQDPVPLQQVLEGLGNVWEHPIADAPEGNYLVVQPPKR